jgi:type II secretion system protein N
MKRPWLYYALGIPAGLLCFLYLTVLFLPNDAIRGVIGRAAENAGYAVEFTDLRKALPLGLKARTVLVSSERGSLVKLSDARVALNVLPLFLGRLQLGYRGHVGTGELSGDITLGKNPGWDLSARGIHLEDIPFFGSVAGAQVKGELRATGALKTVKGVADGELQLEVRGAELASVKIGEMPLPDAAYQEVRGALKIDKGRALLKSFTLNGDGIYLRLKGDVALVNPLPNSPLNLTLEMMPKPAFMERQKFVFLLLAKYLGSPGAYSIPIRGSLGHPSL